MAVDIFIQFVPSPAAGGAATFDGESLDRAHAKMTELSEVSFGVENVTTIGSATTGAGAGKAKFQSFTIKKRIDSISAALFGACTRGGHFTDVKLFIRKAGAAGNNAGDYLRYGFKTVFITKIEMSCAAGDDGPTETVEVAYGAMQVEFFPQDPTTGKLAAMPKSAIWSQIKNAAVFE